MNILLTGSTGYVGNIIKANLGKKHKIIGVNLRSTIDKESTHCDLTDEKAVLQFSKNIKPDIVIHAAGNKNIEFCEKNQDKAFQINCNTVKNLVKAFANQCKIIYISTDYVFDGYRGGYEENDTPNPATMYGKSKYCGEIEGAKLTKNNFVILRLSALYDINATFPKYLINKLKNNEPIECFSDVLYSPTYYKDLLKSLEGIFSYQKLNQTIFHTCGEPITRYNFAYQFAEIFGFNPKLIQKTQRGNKDIYLYPNLSMKNETTEQILQTKKFKIIEALKDMKKENIL
ncbi:MAG: sugar nucleotide-binding protein [Candidatus Woesearchaeota archaeon]|jgi:dTDP-4-dehydrorhamnose reductase